jgi:hypothetical protein
MYIVKTRIQKSCIEGDGTFAGEFIPKGTIVYFYSTDEIFISQNEFLLLSEAKRDTILKYGVQDEAGNWVDGEDKLNHSCDANILSIFIDGIYCDIAVKDIYEGEEITIDYGLFYSSSPYNKECNCNTSICRKIVTSGLPTDIQTQERWHSRISEAISHIHEVKQNLFFLEDEKAKALTSALKTKLNPKIFPYTKFSLISEE